MEIQEIIQELRQVIELVNVSIEINETIINAISSS